jgi:hypothetical protein
MKKKLKNMKKAQIMTFDFSSSIIIFLIFLVLFVGLFVFSQKNEKKPDFEVEYVFANLENNLQFGPAERDFFADYRVDKIKLENFASAIGSGSINPYVIGIVGQSHGIGLDETSYDICLYFTDNNKDILTILPGMPEIKVLGSLTKTASSCNHEMIALGNDPCDKYNQAISLFKPVLLDENDYNKTRIIQMNIVMCKR